MNFIVFFPVIFIVELFTSVPSSRKHPQNGTIHSIWNASHQSTNSTSITEFPSLPSLPESPQENSETSLSDDYSDEPDDSASVKTKEEIANEYRRSFVRQMTIGALPNIFNKSDPSAMLTSMSTLWIMSQTEPDGPLREAFSRGRHWIETQLNVHLASLDLTDQKVSSLVSRLIGSLLSCYALTGDRLYLTKAQQVYTQLKLRKPEIEFSYLNRIELKYFGDLTEDSSVWNKAKFEESLNLKRTFSGNLDILVSIVKSFAQSSAKDLKSFKLFKETIDSYDQMNTFKSAGQVCLGEEVFGFSYCTPGTVHFDQMGASNCHLGAMFALSAESLRKSLITKKRSILKSLNSAKGSPGESAHKEVTRMSRYWALAEQLTDTCHQITDTRTGQTPEQFLVNESATPILQGKGNSLTSPQLAESYFLLWRLTRQVKFRQYAWEMAQSLSRSRTNLSSSVQPDLLASTLKYLYLTFSPDHLLPSDEWIFNEAGQPLPVCGLARVYPAESCKSL